MNPGHRIPRAFALALALLGVAGAGQAQPGALDLGFANGNGYFGAWFDYLPGGSSDEVATAIVRHDDGRLTVVGHFAHADGSNRDCGLLRTDADAALYDASFLPPLGFGAIAIDNGGDDDDVCMAALDRGAMTVLVAGGSGLLAPGERSGTLLLLAADGSLDPSFFDDGVFQTVGDLGLYEPGLSVTFERLRAMPDGGVLAAGQLSRNGAGERVVLLRLDSELKIDPAFNGGALMELADPDPGFPDLDFGDVQVDADGYIALTATAYDVADPAVVGRGLLVRLQGDGTPVPGFGNEGRRAIAACALSAGLARVGDGYAVACVPPTPGLLAGIARLDAEGAALPNFGDGGFSEIRVGASDANPISISGGLRSLPELAALPDGGLVGVGTYVIPRSSVPQDGITDLVAVRMLADGRLDPGFGNGGSARYSFGVIRDNRAEHGTALALVDDSGLLAIGSRNRPSAGTDGAEFIVPRLHNRATEVFRDGFE